MYKSIPNNLTHDELTSVVHYCIKILNKTKSVENKDLDFDKIPFRDINAKLDKICTALFREIKIKSISENDRELDKHINNLFALLSDRLKAQSAELKKKGSDLLAQFGANL